MNPLNKANQNDWDAIAPDWQALREQDQLWWWCDLMNPLAEAGLVLSRLAESPAKDARFWEGFSYVPGMDQGLQDWRKNPRAGLPVCLSAAATKQFS
jgi:hypothetical protein